MQSDRQDRSAAGWDAKERENSEPEKAETNVEKGRAGNLKSRFEQLAMQGNDVC